MAEKDKVQRTLESYNDVFADIVNVLLYNGQEVIKEDELIDAQPFSYYKMDGKNIRSLERDVAKIWNNGEIRLSFIGLENQMKIDKFMPVRVIGYDGAAYRSQLVERGTKKCFPVVSLVLYFGVKRRWRKNTTLKEVIEVPENLNQFVSDYKINVFEIAWLTDEQIRSFKSDFREVALFLKCKRTGEMFYGSKQKIKHVLEILDLLRVMADNDKSIIDAAMVYATEELSKGGIDMCNVIQQWVDVGRNEGKESQAKNDAIELLKEKIAPEVIAKCIKLPLEKVLELQKEISVTA